MYIEIYEYIRNESKKERELYENILSFLSLSLSFFLFWDIKPSQAIEINFIPKRKVLIIQY